MRSTEKDDEDDVVTSGDQDSRFGSSMKKRPTIDSLMLQ